MRRTFHAGIAAYLHLTEAEASELISFAEELTSQ
ncbi:hypothetical protein BH09MYX1_BH09MYX1_39450 [soil metagenome]